MNRILRETAVLGYRAAIDDGFYLRRRFDVKGAGKASKRLSFLTSVVPVRMWMRPATR
ncbi:MAG TPA: hypothetical protein VII35_17235 [Steroidobacteraceae bacterium]